jgi:hypothetical protein
VAEPAILNQPITVWAGSVPVFVAYRGYQSTARAAGLRVPGEQEELSFSSIQLDSSNASIHYSTLGLYAITFTWSLTCLRYRLPGLHSAYAICPHVCLSGPATDAFIASGIWTYARRPGSTSDLGDSATSGASASSSVPATLRRTFGPRWQSPGPIGHQGLASTSA